MTQLAQYENNYVLSKTRHTHEIFYVTSINGPYDRNYCKQS